MSRRLITNLAAVSCALVIAWPAFITNATASAGTSAIAATASNYATLPTDYYSGQMAADPTGNLFIEKTGSCQIYEIPKADPNAVVVLANTVSSWCGTTVWDGYGLQYASIGGKSVLIESNAEGSIFEVPLFTIVPPVLVATVSSGSTGNLVYNPASNTLVVASFNADSFAVVSHFSTCSGSSVCHGSDVAISGSGHNDYWGIALTGSSALTSTVYLPTDTQLFGTAPLTGGTLSLHGTNVGSNFDTISQDARGDVFIMNPNGHFWEIPAGSTTAIPLTFATPLPAADVTSDYAMVYSGGSLYALDNLGPANNVFRVSAPVFAVPATPSAPKLTKAVAGKGSITLAWKAPTSTGNSVIIGYKVFVGTKSKKESIKAANFVKITGTSYVLKGLKSGVKYFVVVKAVNKIGLSLASNELSATAK